MAATSQLRRIENHDKRDNVHNEHKEVTMLEVAAKLGINVSELGRKIGVSPTTIYRLRSGDEETSLEVRKKTIQEYRKVYKRLLSYKAETDDPKEFLEDSPVKVSVLARHLGISRQAFYKNLSDYPENMTWRLEELFHEIGAKLKEADRV